MTGPSSRAELRKHLDHWMAEGLIDSAQATRIEAAEASAPGSTATGPAVTGSSATGSRAPLVAEALGYADGVLAIAAGLYMVRDFWPNLSASFVVNMPGVLTASRLRVRSASRPVMDLFSASVVSMSFWPAASAIRCCSS